VTFELSRRRYKKALAAHNLYHLPADIRRYYLEIYQRCSTFHYRPHHRVSFASAGTVAGKASARW
jgi:hypothetical protein